MNLEASTEASTRPYLFMFRQLAGPADAHFASLIRIKVSQVRVFNRGDCCGSRLDGFVVRLGNRSGVEGFRVALQCESPGKISQGRGGIARCPPGSEGSYVFVGIPGKRAYLSLCEVEVMALRPSAAVSK